MTREAAAGFGAAPQYYGVAHFVAKWRNVKEMEVGNRLK